MKQSLILRLPKCIAADGRRFEYRLNQDKGYLCNVSCNEVEKGYLL